MSSQKKICIYVCMHVQYMLYCMSNNKMMQNLRDYNFLFAIVGEEDL